MNEQLEQSDVKPAAPLRTKSKRFAARANRGAKAPLPSRPAVLQAPVDDEEGFFARHRTKLIVAGVLAVIGAAGFVVKPGQRSAPKAPEHMVTIQLPHLPPPPPPPPPKVQPPPPPKEQKMVEQAPVEADKPKEPDKPKDEPPQQALGTGIKGDGPGMAGLGGSGNGGGFGGPQSGGGGSKWGLFAGQVQTKVASALRSNSRTNKTNLKIQVRIWPDTTGRITRAKLDASTGDPKLDAVIQNEILTGLQLDQPPPAGMPLPIVMRLTARRP